MARLTADQIVERIANANGTDPDVMRQQIEQTRAMDRTRKNSRTERCGSHF